MIRRGGSDLPGHGSRGESVTLSPEKDHYRPFASARSQVREARVGAQLPHYICVSTIVRAGVCAGARLLSALCALTRVAANGVRLWTWSPREQALRSRWESALEDIHTQLRKTVIERVLRVSWSLRSRLCVSFSVFAVVYYRGRQAMRRAPTLRLRLLPSLASDST